LCSPDIVSIEELFLFLKQISESQNGVAFPDVILPACPPGTPGLIRREATGCFSGHLLEQTPITHFSRSAERAV
jgi:hypothetical protein